MGWVGRVVDGGVVKGLGERDGGGGGGCSGWVWGNRPLTAESSHPGDLRRPVRAALLRGHAGLAWLGSRQGRGLRLWVVCFL